jgi:hypothetical protein
VVPELEDLEAIAARAVEDVGFFAEVLIGEPLWPHQLELVRSTARFRCVCAGRQVGKTRALAVIALHEAFSRPDFRVLVISAGDDAAKELLAEAAGLAGSPLLAGSLLDDNLSQLVLSNGSVIRSVPASTKRARGKAVDLLILDEAAFIDEELWNAAKFTILARAGSRVVLASTPYGRRDRFFSVLWRRGLPGPEVEPDPLYASWHWPSSVSPLVDRELLEEWRRTDPPRVFRREVEAEWVDEAGAYFTSEELDAAVREEARLVPPADAAGMPVVGGLDWGFAMDANALVLVGIHLEATARREDGLPVYFVPWLAERYSTAFSVFADEVAQVAEGFTVQRLVSELNGPGIAATEMLRGKLPAGVVVEGVSTTARSKENAFGQLKLLLQQRRFLLPPEPELRKQLSALEFETLESGTVRIAVPERLGHDDLAMALAQAMLVVLEAELGPAPEEQVYELEDLDPGFARVTIGPDV